MITNPSITICLAIFLSVIALVQSPVGFGKNHNRDDLTLSGDPLLKRSIKIIALLKRRQEISRAEFKDHYETHHVRLAQAFFEGWPGYVRNHIEVVFPDQTLDFDVITMFWYKNTQHLQSTIELLSDERGQIVRDDELTFMMKGANHYYPVKELLASDTNSTDMPWKIGFSPSTENHYKLIALLRSGIAGPWKKFLHTIHQSNKPVSLITWVSNTIENDSTAEFEQLTEMWFTNPTAATGLMKKWQSQFPGIIFVSVSTFESSLL
jgi:hypothetical protein